MTLNSIRRCAPYRSAKGTKLPNGSKISVLFTDEMFAQIEDIAVNCDMTFAEAVRFLVSEGFARLEGL